MLCADHVAGCEGDEPSRVEQGERRKQSGFFFFFSRGGWLKDEVLASLAEFVSPVPGVAHLAAGQAEGPERDWAWRQPDFRYSPARAKAQPGYVGSYWCVTGRRFCCVVLTWVLPAWTPLPWLCIACIPPTPSARPCSKL